MEPNKTVRVRIAVAVSASGHWCCDGGTRGAEKPTVFSDDTIAQSAAQGLWSGAHPAHSITFIEADIPLPVAVTVEGTVTK